MHPKKNRERQTFSWWKHVFFFPLFTPDCLELNSELNTDTRKSSRWCARLIKHLCTRGGAVAVSPTTTAAPGRRFHGLIERFFSSANPISSAAVRIYVSAGVGQPRRRTSHAAKSTTQLRVPPRWWREEPAVLSPGEWQTKLKVPALTDGHARQHMYMQRALPVMRQAWWHMEDNIKRTEMSRGEMVQMNRTLSTSQFKRLSVLILSKGEASLGLFTISACEKKKKKKHFHLVCRV